MKSRKKKGKRLKNTQVLLIKFTHIYWHDPSLEHRDKSFKLKIVIKWKSFMYNLLRRVYEVWV